MDIYEQLSKQLHRIRSMVRELQADPRCLEDSDLENAAERLNSFAREESQKLADLETNHLVDRKAELEEAVQKLALHTDLVEDNLESENALETTRAIDDLLKACTPLV